MDGKIKNISHAHLHAYADRELIKPRHADVRKYIKTHPTFLIYIRDYQHINKLLHDIFDPVLDEPIPERLLEVVKSTQGSHSNNTKKRHFFFKNKLLIVLLGMVLGGIIGMVLHRSHDSNLLSKAIYVVETLISRII